MPVTEARVERSESRGKSLSVKPRILLSLNPGYLLTGAQITAPTRQTAIKRPLLALFAPPPGEAKAAG
jgi:hypothetical protein